jgi:hypothetical protein
MISPGLSIQILRDGLDAYLRVLNDTIRKLVAHRSFTLWYLLFQNGTRDKKQMGMSVLKSDKVTQKAGNDTSRNNFKDQRVFVSMGPESGIPEWIFV